ncbi:MAG TPA: DUF3644 domain-containing protein, partial [Syntrophales bacterium]|nr:DUF3644 domain-containing protein [Syntrophales bacterium]
YLGSYRNLLQNAKAAMLAYIEIYNKPRFQYRDECFTILLINAWELILKALLSKNRKSIYYKKRRNEPYKTLSWQDAFSRAEKFFPNNFQAFPVRRNLEMLNTYRNNAVHFYNAKNFRSIIYSLAQTSIVNFRDLLAEAFGVHIEEEITWSLMPLGLHCPVDPITYISNDSSRKSAASAPVNQFLTELASALKDVESQDLDTGRLMTVFRVKLESVKKVEHADVVTSVQTSSGGQGSGPLVIEKRFDPNDPNWVRRKEILEEIGDLHGRQFTSHTFEAVIWQNKIKENSRLCWISEEGVLTKYSREVIAIIRRLPKKQVDEAISAYKEHMRARSRRKKA